MPSTGLLHDCFSEAKSVICNFVEGIGPIYGIFMLQIFEQTSDISWWYTVFEKEWLWRE